MSRPPPAPIRITRCGPQDVPLVQRLAHATWRAHYPGILTDAQIDYMLANGYSDDALLGLMRRPGGAIALASIDGEPAGFAAWYRADEPGATKLDKLYVLPAMHGRGIGRALIAHVEDVARAEGCRSVVLNVNKNNAGSIAMYERCGFRTREAVVIDIGNGFVMDDYVMEKRLA
jgi:ribosomal protein S18 acetylase RimI-like enzyme